MKMKSISLMTGVAVAALVFGAPGAFAQVAITQGTAVTPITNSAAVTGTAADSITTSGAISGLLSGASIGSTGVVASVGVLGSKHSAAAAIWLCPRAALPPSTRLRPIPAPSRARLRPST